MFMDELLVMGVKKMEEIFSLHKLEVMFIIYSERVGANGIQ
jgi:hypothetical protein